MYRSRTVWRLNYRMVLSAERELEPASLLNPRTGTRIQAPFLPRPTPLVYHIFLLYQTLRGHPSKQ